MKVIFLDFDGIINDYLTLDYVNKKNVLVLKKILDATGAKIVVTSSNKYQFQIDSTIDIKRTLCYKVYIKQLEENGVNIFDFTPLVNQDRKLEIMEYLKVHPEVEQYLILDDDYIIDKIKEHEIYLDLESGLQEKHIVPAIEILNGNLHFYHDYHDLDETSEERCIRMNKKILKHELGK